MTSIKDLIKDNKTNHYKLLVIIGNNKVKIEEIITFLKKDDWKVYDIEEKVLDLTKEIPKEKIRLRIGTSMKKWVKSLGNKIVLVNTDILYSKEMDKIGPFDAFKYNMRGDKEGILFMNAKLRGNYAIYSTPDRPDYSERELSDVLFVELDKVELEG